MEVKRLGEASWQSVDGMNEEESTLALVDLSARQDLPLSETRSLVRKTQELALKRAEKEGAANDAVIQRWQSEGGERTASSFRCAFGRPSETLVPTCVAGTVSPFSLDSNEDERTHNSLGWARAHQHESAICSSLRTSWSQLHETVRETDTGAALTASTPNLCWARG